MEKSASECDGGTSAPKKTVYMGRDSNPDGQKSSPRLVAAEPPALIKGILSTVYIQLVASPALPSPGCPEKARRDSCTSMPNRGHIVYIKKALYIVLLKVLANSEGN